MVTLKQALQLNQKDLKSLKEELHDSIKKNAFLGAYVEQLKKVEIKDNNHTTIPIAVKDNIAVAGAEMSCCSKILQGYTSPYNATIIDKMLEANLAPFGRTNMDEFAMGSSTETSCYGKTLNPHDHLRVPGGSSGGSAAAVAAKIAIAAIGTDTGGSIRQPASFCGCVGMKPTYGRVSRYGITAYSSSLDQAGPITQNVEDAAILYDIMSGHDPKDSTSANIEYKKVFPNLNPNRKFTIAVIENFINQASGEVQKGFLQTLEILQSQGHRIVYKNMIDTATHISSYYIIATAEASANLSRFDGIRYGVRASAANLKDLYFNSRSAGFGEEVQRRILLGSFVLSSGYYDAYYVKAQKIRHLIKNDFEKIFQDSDVILSPVAPTTAFLFNSMKTPLEMYLSDIYTISVNLAGLPAISLPVAKDSNNMPIGLQFIGKAFDEQTLFDVAYGLEQALQ